MFSSLLSLSAPSAFASFCFFFFNDTATTEIYTLSLHDALPISHSPARAALARSRCSRVAPPCSPPRLASSHPARSEEHTSELQSRLHLVCRLLLEKKKASKRCADHRRGHPRTRRAP